MNSPEPICPSDSTSSTGSPPPEEVAYQFSPHASYFANLTSQITSSLARTAGVGGSSSSKRRLPGSSYTSGPSDRDAKARKKTGDTGRGNPQYEGSLRDVSTKKDREELVDSGTVEWLRKGNILLWNLFHLLDSLSATLVEVGDPFLEPEVKF